MRRSATRWPASTYAAGSSEITLPVLAIAGVEDQATPPAKLEEIAEGSPPVGSSCSMASAHLAPAEQPDEVARLLREQFDAPGAVEGPPTTDDVYAAGMTVRREVLGDAHVDRATRAATDFTREFQEFITTYAWGSIWTRPGLDRRSRSLITLTALVARGHHEELAMHVRAARTNGLTNDEIRELLLQTAIYCGVPDANTAFRIAQGGVGRARRSVRWPARVGLGQVGRAMPGADHASSSPSALRSNGLVSGRLCSIEVIQYEKFCAFQIRRSARSL